MSDSSRLAGRTAVVTGASSGIGRAIAERFGAAGAHVFLAGRTPAAMEASQKKIEEAGGRARALVVDVRDVAQVQDLVDGAVRETGRLDIMGNNAGVSYPAPITDGDPVEVLGVERLPELIHGLLVLVFRHGSPPSLDHAANPASSRRASW